MSKSPFFWVFPRVLSVKPIGLHLQLPILALAMAIFGGAACPALAEPYQAIAKRLVGNLPADAQFRADLERQLAGEANAYRRAQGVGALKSSTALQLAARAQATDMMLNNFVGHRATTGQEFESRMRSFVGNPMMMPRLAENAARETQKGEANAAKASRLFQQWVKSRPHRHSLLDASYNYVSTGVVQRGNKIWAVQIFWNQLPEGAATPEPSDGVY
jgi:uncharacterized protein YkwD